MSGMTTSTYKYLFKELSKSGREQSPALHIRIYKILQYLFLAERKFLIAKLSR